MRVAFPASRLGCKLTNVSQNIKRFWPCKLASGYKITVHARNTPTKKIQALLQELGAPAPKRSATPSVRSILLNCTELIDCSLGSSQRAKAPFEMRNVLYRIVK